MIIYILKKYRKRTVAKVYTDFRMEMTVVNLKRNSAKGLSAHKNIE